MSKNGIVIWLSLLVYIPGMAADSTAVFTIEDFMVQIAAHHPVAQQARLLSKRARQEIRMARGAFDPSANVKFYQKELGGKNYYTLWDNVLKVPLWFGADLKAGFERNSGINVNGENITPSQGLNYIGISVPIGQGLMIDERRSVLQQAKLASDLAEAEKIKLINKLLYEAAKTYWEWAFAYHKWKLYQQGYELANFRLLAVKERTVQGDLAAIDSVEAIIELQNRQALTNQAWTEYQNAALLTSNFLWSENNTPLEIPETVIPSLLGTEIEPVPADSVVRMADIAQISHPEITKLRVKLGQLEVERRFTTDKLKPKLNLEYNLIGKGGTVGSDWVAGPYLSNNYKFGASFSFPLFLRQERGKLQVTRLKMIETNLELQQTNRENLNQIYAAYKERQMLEEQIRLQEQIVANSTLLRNGEQQRFENGESSLFLINSREMSLLSQQVKLHELKTKYGKSKYNLQWSAGNLASVIADNQ